MGSGVLQVLLIREPSFWFSVGVASLMICLWTHHSWVSFRWRYFKAHSSLDTNALRSFFFFASVPKLSGPGLGPETCYPDLPHLKARVGILIGGSKSYRKRGRYVFPLLQQKRHLSQGQWHPSAWAFLSVLQPLVTAIIPLPLSPGSFETTLLVC